jgi:hypothetical protein
VSAIAAAGALAAAPFAQAATASFSGDGSGYTPDLAIQSAIENAETIASDNGYAKCEMVGDAQVAPMGDDADDVFEARVSVSCVG